MGLPPLSSIPENRWEREEAVLARLRDEIARARERGLQDEVERLTMIFDKNHEALKDLKRPKRR